MVDQGKLFQRLGSIEGQVRVMAGLMDKRAYTRYQPTLKGILTEIDGIKKLCRLSSKGRGKLQLVKGDGLESAGRQEKP